GVDGEERAVAEVEPVGEVLGQERLRRAPRGLERVLRERVGDVAAGDDLRDLGARVVGIAEDVDHARGQLAAGARRVADDLGDDALPLARGAGALLEADLPERRRDARVVGLEVEGAAGGPDAAGEPRPAAREHLLDLALAALPAEPRREPDLVAVERGAAEAGRHEDVGLAVLALDEAVAGRV